jgi:putative oxidoreductase
MITRTSQRNRAVEWLGVVVRCGATERVTDVALAAARVALSWIFIYYGAGKLFGAFNGPGIHATAIYFSNTAHLHPGGFFAVLGGVIEFGGGIAMALGLGTRLAALALFGDMVLAMITVTWSTGINSKTSPPGYQLNLVLCALALVVVLLGAGRLSVDRLIEKRFVLTHVNSEVAGQAPLAADRTRPVSEASPNRPQSREQRTG